MEQPTPPQVQPNQASPASVPQGGSAQCTVLSYHARLPGFLSPEFLFAAVALVAVFFLLWKAKLDAATASILIGFIVSSNATLSAWLRAKHLDKLAGLLSATPEADKVAAGLKALYTASATGGAAFFPQPETAPIEEHPNFEALKSAYPELTTTTDTSATKALDAAVATNPPPSPAAIAAPSSTQSGQAGVRMLCLLALGSWLLALSFTGCGTTAGTNVANALESDANHAIVAAAVQAGANSLVASLGGKVPPTLQQPLATGAGAVATGVVWGGIYAGAEALRTKQGTDASAKPGALTTALVNQAGLPADKAQAVAQSVAALSQKGIAPDIANEAVASSLDAVAAAKAPDAKTIAPTQARASASPRWRQVLYTPEDQPVYPLVVNRWEAPQ